MVGERGFEPPTTWSGTNKRCTNLLSRLGLFCVLTLVEIFRICAITGAVTKPTAILDGPEPLVDIAYLPGQDGNGACLASAASAFNETADAPEGPPHR
jgi:hypothetical protein